MPQSVRILFQITGDEIALSSQTELFNTDSSFDEGTSGSFIFITCELNGTCYPRGQYAQFTREINKRLNQPTVVVFKTTEDLLTLAFVHRRPHKHDGQHEVLGKVSLIREISPSDPHRAHLDILAQLSLEERLRWMKSHNKAKNFIGLLDAWLEALDTEALNRRFYRDLFTWFEWALLEAKFPKIGPKIPPPEEHVIRLITRLLFVWFIKEKGLIANELFIEEQISPLLKNFDRYSGDSYYRTILQNLFFATLNTEISRREFSKVSNTTHRDFSRYRYYSEIQDPDELLALFDQTPFINGGLFDCLDSEEATRYGGYRIDCFSDNPRHRDLLSIPNRLFFSSSASNPGLINLLKRYIFTVEENTPIEQEVALDPELLGKVFENLLAAYNPETRETARKQTGSYYTPRAVVDYMVDEALVAMLEERVQPSIQSDKFWRDRLHYLLDHAAAFNDANELFLEDEAEAIVRAISEIKVLDPAVGSGAFPMGMLHKLTLALQRLDPDNQRWEALQKILAKRRAADAFDTSDQKERVAELQEISDTFEKYRDSDYGRKLYLIQNSIFGVDIQPVACQIAKLRIFISLAIEQAPDKTADNFGIKPLPNLETRFISANTLLSLKGQRVLLSDYARKLEREVQSSRERHFHATTRKQKLACRRKDQKLRKKLSKELSQTSLSTGDADRIAHWDPYDQNATADFFDAEWMFGVTDGFDVIIGNPPYIQLSKNKGELANLYDDAGYATFARSGDIYQLFCERGCQLLTPSLGLLAYITSNSWLKAQYGKPLRSYLTDQHTPLKLLEMGKDVFENTIVDTSVLLLREGGSSGPFPAVDMDKLAAKDFPPNDNSWEETRPASKDPWTILSSLEHSVMDKMKAIGTPLKEWDIAIFRGIVTGYNAAFIIDNETKDALIAENPSSAEIIKPILRGKDIRRYQAQWADLWLIYSHFGVAEDEYLAIRNHLLPFQENLANRRGGANRRTGQVPYKWWQLQVDYYKSGAYKNFEKEKLFWMDMSPRGRFAYSDGELYCNDKGFIMAGNSLKYFCAILNSSLITWLMKNTALTTGMGLIQWKKFAVQCLPIPKITVAEQRPFTRLVDDILAAKATNPAADTEKKEREIDRLVYKLYALTEEEIAEVTGQFEGMRKVQ